METSKLTRQIQKSKIRVMYDLARKKENVLNFTVGEPDFMTPKEIVEVSNRYFSEGYTKYTPNAGVRELTEAIAQKYESVTGRNIQADSQVIVTVGATEALLVAMQTVMDPGDEILICGPYFPSYINQIFICHCKPVIVPTAEEDGWMPKAEEIEKQMTPRTKMLLLNSPCNPTGAVIDETTLREIAALCVRHQIVVISDEVYKDIRYNEEPYFSIASVEGMEELTVIVNSFSKTYAMPGWRVGYAVGPEWILSQMPKTHDVTAACVCAPFQYAGAYALRHCDARVEEMVAKFKARRDLVYQGINSIDGLSAVQPQGAFYLFFNIKKLGMTSEEFAYELLDKEGVVLVPGTGFGEEGEGYIRFTYAADEESLKRGLERIQRFVRGNC